MAVRCLGSSSTPPVESCKSVLGGHARTVSRNARTSHCIHFRRQSPVCFKILTAEQLQEIWTNRRASSLYKLYKYLDNNESSAADDTSSIFSVKKSIHRSTKGNILGRRGLGSASLPWSLNLRYHVETLGASVRLSGSMLKNKYNVSALINGLTDWGQIRRRYV